MSQDYQSAVFATYIKKRDEGELRVILPTETTARLKKACLKVFDSRYNQQDADILSVFFDKDKMGTDFRKVILEAEADDFRALYNHIKGLTESTDEKNSDLLAWLIDFEFRPSISYYKSLKEGPCSSTDTTVKTPTPPTGQFPKDSKSPLSIGSILIISIGCLLIGYASFIVWENSSISTRLPNSDEKCMYWKDDHYEPINCNEKINGATVIKLNLEKLQNLKKINLPDTLSKNSIGKVWYTGRGDNHEYFTDSGMHPVDTVKRLRPFSSYIQTSHISYPRYLLTRTIWLLGGIVTLLIIFGLYILFWKKREKSNA